MMIFDPKQKYQELHTSERTIVPRTVIFDTVVRSSFLKTAIF